MLLLVILQPHLLGPLWKFYTKNILKIHLKLQKKCSLALGIFSVNVSKSTVSYGFGHIY